ncbi:hypothetical protein [Paenibacillus puerhi]|uniref:hypothetical protein n=1 Tax=Paenibacillus puerhi TaxID=2692622 RepID=UPI00135884E4|nr:hypothetical protein [Paenibacillus puerhi]
MEKKLLLLDTAVIKKFENMTIKPGEIKKSSHNPLFTEDFFSNPPRPWEVRYDNGYPNVFYDEAYKIYRCYYTLFVIDQVSATTPLDKRRGNQYVPRPGRETGLAYAYSEDGINWIKPSLGTVEFQGSTDNNLIMLDAHGASVFRDPRETDPAKRYKMMLRLDEDPRLLAASFSPDGVHWCEPIPWEPRVRVIKADTHNFAYWDEHLEKYVLISRHWTRNLRNVVRSESDDFINWSKPVEVFKGDGLDDQIYSMPIFRYADLYLGLATIYHDGDRELAHWDKVDCELTFSGDTLSWSRVCSGVPVIPRGKGEYPDGDYDSGCIYPSIPVVHPDRIDFYYMGGNGQHTNFRETSLNVASIGIDRFAGYEPVDKLREGTLETSMLTTTGGCLCLTADIWEDGYVKVEIRDRDGNPVDGYRFEEFQTITETMTDGAVLWNKYDELGSHEQGFKIGFKVKNARLYAIKGRIALKG